MITTDQPTCFPDDVIVAVSAREDGTMLDKAAGVHSEDIVVHRRNFCIKAGVCYDDTVYQRIVYSEEHHYDVVRYVDEKSVTRYREDVEADALVTTQAGVALFLPIADCVPTVIYDSSRRVLAMAHLGRHSTYANLAEKVIAALVAQGGQARDLVIWMGPHAGRQSYRLAWFDREDYPEWSGFFEVKSDGTYIDLAGFNKNQYIRAGVPEKNIFISSVDTVTHPHYFSHSMGEASGRIAVVAMMR